MPSMRHTNSLVNLLDKQLRQISASKMKISKSAPDLLRKVVTSFKSKTDALRTKLIILTSLRRRMAMVATMARKIHAPVSSSREKAMVDYCDGSALVLGKAMVPREEAAADHGGKADLGGLFEVVAMFDEDDRGYHGWTSSLFNDDNHYFDDEEDAEGDHDDDLDVPDAEPSVIDIIRSNREAKGLEFNMDDDIDEACDMFIRRCRRSRMNLSF
ncbi:hypothetical protein BS78_02G237700 [Paspalum vaginatum]|nr:hypothetical protein BS78_02G237700 [Paspalum vaginatum]